MADKKKKKNTEAQHAGLDLAGLAPGSAGMLADGLNTEIYFLDGDVKNALVSGASAIPVYGNASKAGSKMAKAVDKVTDAVKGIKTIDQVKDTEKNAIKAVDAARETVKAEKTVKKSKKQAKLSKRGEKKVKAALKLKHAKKGKMRTGAKKASNRNNRKKTTQAQKNKNKKKQLKGKCFTADMLVLTGRGYRQIKEIRKGDDIYSRNAKTGTTGLRKVAGVFQEEAHTIHHIWLDGKEELKMTAYHPVYVKDRGWVKAINLRQGDLLETMDGTSQVTKVEKTRHEEPVEVYNFQVEEWESYFVSEMRVYVHNGEGDCGSGKIKNLETKNSETTRVGRWMSEDEYNKMVETKQVQMSGDNKVHVANPASIEAFGKQAPKGSVYVEFDVPSNTVFQGGKAEWGIIAGPGSIQDRLNKQKGLPAINEMPKATNIEIKGRK